MPTTIRNYEAMVILNPMLGEEETEALVERGLLHTPTARQALGYRTIAAYLHGDVAGPDQLEARLFGLTWAYARRQRTWFRHQHPGATVLPLRPETRPQQIAAAILSVIAR